MGIFSLISHLGVIMAFVSASKDYAESAIKNKELPVASDPVTRRFFDAASALVASEVVDFPGVDEAQIAAGIKMIEEKICGV
jgi:hypothetical protein